MTTFIRIYATSGDLMSQIIRTFVGLEDWKIWGSDKCRVPGAEWQEAHARRARVRE